MFVAAYVSRALKIFILLDSTVFLLGIYPKKNKNKIRGAYQDFCVRMFTNMLFMIKIANNEDIWLAK